MKKLFTALTFFLLVSYSAVFAHSVAFCPDISQIKKNPIKMNWSAYTQAGYWKSYHMSFATKLLQFMGAEWQGEVVGQVYCIYRAEQQFTMNGVLNTQTAIPVALFFHALTYMPIEGHWKLLKEGAMLCKGTVQSDCPFKVHIKKSVGDIFKEAEALKDKQSQALQEPIN